MAAIDQSAAQAVLERITEQEVVDLALHLASVESPPGEEGEAGDAIYAWLEREGFSPRRVGMFEDRFNVFCELEGAGTGPVAGLQQPHRHLDAARRPPDLARPGARTTTAVGSRTTS